MPQTGKYPSKTRLTYQQQLEASERRFRSLVKYGSDLMVIIDTSGNYLYVTDPSKRVMGYVAGFFLDKNAIDFIHPEDAPKALSSIRKLLPDDYIELSPYRFRAANGDWRWIESKVVNLSEDPAIGGLVVNSRDVTEKRRLEADRLKHTQIRQKQITRAVLQAQEKERCALGNELHDNVNQLLTTAKLYLVMTRDGNEMREDLLPKAIGYIQTCIDEIRSLTTKLVSPQHIDIGLEESIKYLTSSIALPGTIRIEYRSTGLENITITEEVQLAVYRIAQEQLTNVLKHANATMAAVELSFINSRLVLAISDDGQGFDVQQKRKGSGILNMLNRAETVSGSLSIASAPGAGCTLTAKFPV